MAQGGINTFLTQSHCSEIIQLLLLSKEVTIYDYKQIKRLQQDKNGNFV